MRISVVQTNPGAGKAETMARDHWLIADAVDAARPEHWKRR